MNGPAHTTLAALITHKAQTNPDLAILTFVTVGADGRLEDETRTYRQLFDHSQALARGLKQRAALLEAVLADAYGPATLVADGSLPAALIAGSREFLRPLAGA